MNEWKPAERRAREQPDLDERLRAYYGSALGEEPLAPSAWQDLSARLHTRYPQPRPWRRSWRHRRTARRTPVPSVIVNAFTNVADAARLPYTASLLAYSVNLRLRQPQMRVRPLAKRKLRLSLPARAADTLEPAALDVLLATGLAQYLCMRKPAYASRRLLAYGLMFLTWSTLFWLEPQHLPSLVVPLVIMLCLGLSGMLLWLLHRQGRQMALQADDLLVLWLGRRRACQGLHALAERSRSPLHRRWSALTLAERIAHVCGTSLPVQSERLTLVR